MLLLAIDTSSAAVTAALHDGRRVLGRAETLDARGHAEHLTPMIDSALAQAGAAPGDLTAVAVGVGPGPFTGLRVGLVTGKVLALALGVPVHGLCSLDALAHGALAGADPDVAGPDVAGPDVAGPDVADPEGTDPDVADPEGTDPDVADPDVADPEAADPDVADPDVADPDVADPDVADPDVADPDVADPDVADPDVADPEAAGPEGTPARSPLGEGCEFLVASDARRREVYWARYTVRDGLPRRQGPPRVDSPAALPRGLPVVGRGAVLYGESLGPAREPHEVHAADLARVAVRGLAGEDGLLLPPEPLYLRRPDATVPGTPKRVNGQWSVH